MALAAVLVLLSLGSLVCWVMVLIKMFSSGILTGIVGIICPLYAFIWGWMHSDAVGRNVMLAWTACIVGGIVVQFMGGASALMHAPATP